MASVTVIAEAGVNHNGHLATALALVEAAAAAGADFVKFQTFRADRLSTRTAPKAGYQIDSTPLDQSHYEMLKELELSEEEHFVLRERAATLGIGFLSTPFDLESLDFLVTEMGLDLVKIGSSDTSNLPLLVRVGQLGTRMILSTGMSTLLDVREALGAYVFGRLAVPGTRPDPTDFVGLSASLEGLKVLSGSVSVLHCTSEYPAPVKHVNLAAMDTLRTALGLPVGLSDHTMGIVVPLAAVARGASIIEKHITLDMTMPGPDHSASLEPDEFRRMVEGIRQVEEAIGSTDKAPSAVGLLNRAAVAKSLFAARDIEAGAVITDADIVMLRPGTGVPPREYWSWVGAIAPRAFALGEAIGE